MLKSKCAYQVMMMPDLRKLHVMIPLVLFLFLAFWPGSAAALNSHASSFVGPKTYYLALGDSLAFGYQPNMDWNHGYVDDFYANLQAHGVTTLVNMSCPGETSKTFESGGCPGWLLRKYSYSGSQLNGAVSYLHTHPGKVSPVTLNIGANDLLLDVNTWNCTAGSHFNTDLATLDKNLTATILPQLKKALTVNAVMTGDLVMMNYYDPFQNICPNSVSYIQTVNAHLANDMRGFGTIVDVFTAFGGSHTPNPKICSYTWMCSIFSDIHAQNKGYSVIAKAFENAAGY